MWFVFQLPERVGAHSNFTALFQTALLWVTLTDVFIVYVYVCACVSDLERVVCSIRLCIDVELIGLFIC